jgi:hypothetical protein
MTRRNSLMKIAKLRCYGYHPAMAANDSFTEKTELLALMVELRTEHRDLDEAIVRCTTNPPDDQLTIRRLKKRKLLLKDRIAALERQIDPDEYA